MEEANNTVKYQSWADTICEGFHNELPQVAAITIHDTLGDVIPTTEFDWISLQESHPSTSFTKAMIMDDQEPTDIKLGTLSNDTKNILRHFNKLLLKDESLYYQDSYESPLRLVVPTSHQMQLTTLYHSLGYTDTRKLLPILQERFYWNDMKKTVTNVVSTCERCQKSKTLKHKNRGPLEHIKSPS